MAVVAQFFDPVNSTFNAYLINTNGLKPTKVKPLSGGSDPVKINKIKILRDLAIKWKLNSIHIAETHEDNPVALGPLAGWHTTPSIPKEANMELQQSHQPLRKTAWQTQM
jgi:hypothetical protein